MQIRECRIKNFGKFRDKTIAFQNGINIIYGKNEAGKTTLYHFIKSMFFGLERQRGKASRMDTYSLYEPWEMSLYYEGILKFTAGDKCFRIERGFAKNQRYERLINENDGEELSIAQGDLIQILDGLNESIFSNTIAVGQQKMETEQELAREIKNYTTNQLSGGDSEFSLFGAIGQLKEKKKALEQMLKEQEAQRNSYLFDYEKQKDFLRQEIAEKEERIKEYTIKYKQLEEQIRQEEAIQKQNTKKTRKMWIVLTAGLLAGIFLGIVLPVMLEKIASIIVTALFILLYYKFNQNVIPANATIEYTKEEQKKLSWSIQSLEEEKKEKNLQLENTKEAIQDLPINDASIQKLKLKIDACTLAQKEILALADEIQMERKDMLNKETSTIMSHITQGKYQKIHMDENLTIKINTQDKLLNPEQLSKGTMEELYFSLRMAAARLFFEEEEMPLFFDDAFAYYDEERLARVLDYLAESKRQVLLFTCHKREQELCNKQKVNYHFIELC